VESLSTESVNNLKSIVPKVYDFEERNSRQKSLSVEKKG